MSLSAQREITIDASLEKVWSVVGNFGDGSWSPLIDIVLQEGNGHTVGAVRKVNVGPNHVIERLEAYEANKSLTYRITDDNNPMPFCNYSSTWTVTPVDDIHTKLTFAGQFDFKDDKRQEALDAVTGLYDSLSASAKQVAEQN